MAKQAGVARNWGKDLVIALSLTSAGFVAAWLYFRPYLPLDSGFTDGAQRFDELPRERLRYALWDRVEPLGGGVNTAAAESRPAVSPDGRHLVFAAGEPGLNADLWIADLVGGEPRDARPLAALSSGADELAPAFGPDALWFATDRLGGAGGFDLWRAPYADGRFGAPAAVEGGVNGPGDEYDPAPSPDGSELVFAASRAGDGRQSLTRARPNSDLWLARPDPWNGWSAARLDELSTPFEEREPAFSEDGRQLLFASDRPGGAGGFDVWRSVRDGERWLAPEALAGLNGAGAERAPWPEKDGFGLLFQRGVGESADLWRARSRELVAVPAPPIGWKEVLLLAALLALALLAWLAKRWERLDVLYKCLLVSLVVHLLLMLWFRDVHPESEPVAMRERQPAFRVRLADPPESQRSTRERGGELELARADGLAVDAPARRADADPRARSGSSAEVAPGEVALEVAAAAAPSTPARSQAPVERAQLAETARVDVRAPAVERVLRAGEAPSLTLAARARGERVEAPAPSVPVRAVELDGATASESAPAPSTLALAFARSADAGSAPSRRQAEVARTRVDESERAVEIATPQASFAPRSGDAPALALATPAQSARELVAPEAPRPSATGARDEPSLGSSLASASPVAASAPLSVSAAPLASSSPRRAAELEPALRDAPDVFVRGPEVEHARRAERAEAQSGELELVAQSFAPDPSRRAPEPRAPERPPTPARSSSALALALEAPPAPRPLESLPVAPAPERDEPAAPKLEHTPYRTRFGAAKEHALAEHGGSPETERAVARGLAYLASIQTERGYWGSTRDRDDKYGQVLVGKTGLALLAFLAAGHTPGSGGEHSAVSQRALAFLLSQQLERTGHFGDTSSYSHGIATYAIAECYAMTKDPALRAPLERAVAWILANQERRNDKRLFGGWSYYYPDGHRYDGWPRASITAWQVMALESARIGGIEVPDAALRDAKTFLLSAWDEERGAFRYSHDPSRLSSSYDVLPGSTPAALFALSLLGEEPAGRPFSEAVDFVVDRAPVDYRQGTDSAFVHRAQGNLYFWYYGTMALFRIGGADWERWNASMKNALLPAQEQDGSWRPISIYARYAGDDEGDRSYTTAMCVLTLEVYYRYFTPLLEAGLR